MSIPPAALTVIQSLPEGVQEALMKYGVKSLQNPWWGPTAAIPAAAFLWFLPHMIKINIVLPLQMFEYNNMTPRRTVWKERVKSPQLAAFFDRCEAAHQNSFEAFCLFSFAILMARASKADPAVVGPLALQFLTLRFAYIVLYLAGAVPIISYARTIVWGLNMGNIVAIYKAALDA